MGFMIDHIVLFNPPSSSKCVALALTLLSQTQPHRTIAKLIRRVTPCVLPHHTIDALHCSVSLRLSLGLDGRHYIVDLARAFPPESPSRVPSLSTGSYTVGQKVFVLHPRRPQGRKTFRQATLIHVHDETSCRSYDAIFQADHLIVTSVPQSSIRNGLQCIFWRLLRPEFVKHRGRALIEKYYPLSVGPGSEIPDPSELPQGDVGENSGYENECGSDDVSRRADVSHTLLRRVSYEVT